MNGLLDSVYELEGLIHLALNRDDEPQSLCGLIVRKARDLGRLSLSLENELSNDEEDATPFVAPSLPEEEERLMEKSERQYEELMETTLDPLPDPPMVVDDVKETIHEEEEEPAATLSTAAQEVKVPEVSEKESAAGASPRGRLVFSINDRYRFKRELFGNSDARFNNTLALVASMDDYEEAEDYFLGELQWDAANPEVVDFLEILKKYFKE